MNKLLALVFVLMAATAQAQTKALPERLNWPHTFAGQPDFEFSRAEVVDDAAKQKDGKAVPTMSDLLEDVPLDPLGLTGLKGLQAVSGTSVSGTAAVLEISETAVLPKLNVPDDIDLSEFKRGLAQRVAEYLQSWHPDLRTYELSYLLRSLKLNGVMTSPDRSAIINNVVYRVGDQIKATITISPSDGELLAVMEDQLPAAGTVTPAQAKLYQQAYEAEVADLAKQKEANPAQFQRTFTLPVTVRAIQSRKVTLEFNGMTYDLVIAFAM